MSSNDLLELYSEKIIKFASEITLIERLSSPSISVTKRSPLCGSKVTVDLVVKEKKIINFGQDVKACALGQASASIFSKEVINLEVNQVINAREEVLKMLGGEKIKVSSPFENYNYLSLAKNFKNRHSSIMLVLDATVQGITEFLERD